MKSTFEGTCMKSKEFSNYEKVCEFRDKVDGQIQWTSWKGKKIWRVWYEKKTKKR